MHGSDSVNRFGAVLAAALAELEDRRREIDDLNVFPVADGDTGRNMVMTLRGLVDAIDSLRLSVGGADLTDINRDLVVKAVARAALSSAHGNSGVILSQLIRGAASELGGSKGRKVSPYLLGRAMRGAAEQGIASTPSPREGTMLTVARDIAEALEAAYPEPEWLPEETVPADQDALLAEALEIAVEAGTRSVDRGPELLDVLREKGVVDAGGYGLVVIVAGALAGLRGEERSTLPRREPPRIPVTEGRGPERFGFCVN
ncbi:MAG: DAK2 domain-containing protein, partial [Actinomycetes bacterium]